MTNAWRARTSAAFEAANPEVKANQPNPKSKKAGIFIVGEDGEGELCVVAPWSEGHMAKSGDKSYVMPKGSVEAKKDDSQNTIRDENKEKVMEHTLVAALRETREETGIDIDRIYDPARHGDNKPDTCYEEDVQVEYWIGKDEEGRLTKLSYDEAKPEALSPIFEKGIAPTTKGKAAEYTLYAVKVRGIEKLQAHVKNQPCNNHNAPTVPSDQTVEAQLRDPEQPFPSLDTLKNVAMTGFWTRGGEPSENGRLFEPHLRFAVEHMKMKALLESTASALAWSTTTEIDQARQGRLKKQIQKLLKDINGGRDIEAEHDDIQALYRDSMICGTLQADLEAMREPSGQKDDDGLKLDKHRLNYYQEGADILPFKVYIERMLSQGEQQSESRYAQKQFDSWVDHVDRGRYYRGKQQSVTDMVLNVFEGVNGMLGGDKAASDQEIDAYKARAKALSDKANGRGHSGAALAA